MNLSSLSLGLTKSAGSGIVAAALAILRKYGTDAHVYLPGIGVINGLTAGNYLDSAGTTPITVDNPVGLVLDGAGSVGAELITNGNFSNGTTGWTAVNSTIAVSGNILTCTAVSGAFPLVSQSISTVVGRTYNIVATVKTASKRIGVARQGDSVGYPTTTSTSFVTLRYYFVASATTSNIIIFFDGTGSTGETFSVSNISVKELPGIHALQATTANKPILRRGAVNLLTYSEQFDNAAWTKSALKAFGSGSTANAILAPDGTLSADLLTPTAGGGHFVSQTASVLSGIPHTTSIYAKPNGYNWILLWSSTASAGAYFNVSTGAVGNIIGAVTATIIQSTNGFYRCSITRTTASTSEAVACFVASANGTFSYVADEVSGMYLWGAQLQTGSVATDYVATTTAAASSPTGNYHWVHDSTDLLTATYPAGYESATVINALAAGQQTLTAQNIVGSYSIGPSIDTYGRFIFRTGLTAGELTTIQTFANRLAGV